MLNRAGSTYRKLPQAEQVNLEQPKAIALMLAQPSLIKRPVLEKGSQLLIGFDPKVYEHALAH